MALRPEIGSLVGQWTYRSFLDDPVLETAFAKLEFGVGTLVVDDAPAGILRGTIGGSGWSLAVEGSINYGDPFSLRFQGVGTVDAERWAYDYAGYVVKPWPHGVDQRPAITGTVIRTVPHAGDQPGSVVPAGETACWIAVWREAH